MNKCFAYFCGIVFYILLLLAFCLYANAFATAAWFWIGSIFLFVFFEKTDKSIRGILFVAVSVMIGTAVKKLANTPNEVFDAEIISQMLFLIGGGVGGNFIAYGLIEQEKRMCTKHLARRNYDRYITRGKWAATRNQ